MTELCIGLIGCGGVASGHLAQYEKASGARVTAVCDILPERAKAYGERMGVPEDHWFTDYRELCACPDVDAVDICTPNNVHVPAANAALDHHKPFCVEKPVGVNAAEVEALADRADTLGIPSMVCFSYRFKPAARYAKSLVEQGLLGSLVQVYASYLKDSAFWPGRRLEWRFNGAIARYGVSGDLGVHILDLAGFLCGDVTSVCARMNIAIKERRREDSDEIAPVTTDDACSFLATMKGGADAVFSVSRIALGNGNHITFDVYGTEGALRFDLDHDDRITATRRNHEGRNSSVETVQIPESFRAGQQQTFINLLHGIRDPYLPTLRDGLRMQRVLDALMTSAETRAWVDVV